jgi:hypothetical protein
MSPWRADTIRGPECRGVSDHARTRAEQAYRAFKQQVIALAECTPLSAPLEKDAVMRAFYGVCRVAKRVGA